MSTTPERPGETGPPDQPEQAPALKARLALWAVLSAVLLHTAAIALWVAPGTLLRQEIGAQRLNDYIQPLWDQHWSVFTPATDYATDQLEMRALLRGSGGGQTPTSWAPITKNEVVASVRYHPFPSRTVLITTRLAAGVEKTYNKLSASQKQVFFRASFTVTGAQLLDELRDAAVSDVERNAAEAFAMNEQSTEDFVCGLAQARWGDRIVGVQYRKNRVTVPTYGSGGPRQVASGYSLYSNWRPVPELSAAERAAFRSYADEFGIGAR